MPIPTLWHVTLRAVQNWWQDNCLRLAASLAYYTALSLAPLVLLIVGVVGLALDRQQVAQQLTAQLEGLIGPARRDLRSVGGDLRRAPGAHLLAGPRLGPRVPAPRLARDQCRPCRGRGPVPRPRAG